jgi:allophanate hydrolase
MHCSCAGRYTAADVFQDQATVRSQRAKCLAEMDAKGISVLVVPTVMHHYLVDELAAAEAAGPPFTYNAHLGTFTNFVNLMGMCAISIPWMSFHSNGVNTVRPGCHLLFVGTCRYNFSGR